MKKGIAGFRLAMFCLCLAMIQVCAWRTDTHDASKQGKGGCISLPDYELVWADDFVGRELDWSRWKIRNPGARGDAFNSDKAVSLDGKGNLVIRSYISGDSVFAGMIDTENTFRQKYGYFECRAKLIHTPGIWPAFWLQSTYNGDQSEPSGSGLEIDIFEYFLHQHKDSVSHTLHYGGYGPTHKVVGPVKSALGPGQDGYHCFGLEWSPEGYVIYVDGKLTQTHKGQISHVAQFIVLSLEVDRRIAGELKRSSLPDQFVIDYVHVYRKKGDNYFMR